MREDEEGRESVREQERRRSEDNQGRIIKKSLQRFVIQWMDRWMDERERIAAAAAAAVDAIHTHTQRD